MLPIISLSIKGKEFRINMKKISIVSACTDLGLNIDGADLGATAITNDLNQENIAEKHIMKSKKAKKSSTANLVEKKDTNYFVKEFNKLLLEMHEIHFENEMSQEDKNAYYQKMHNLVLSVKALDTINEKRNLEEINEFNEELYNTILKIIRDGNFPLLVGGDHIIAVASSLASIKENKNLGIIWFDSHSDYNTYFTSVTGNLHGLPLAVATNYEKDILSDFHKGPFYNPKNTVVVGGRDIDPWEWGDVLDSGITVFSTEDIKKYGVEEICKKAFAIASDGTEGVHISLDLDIIDPEVAPGVSVPAKNGLDLKQTYELADEITKYKDIIKSADLVEYNPLFDKDDITKEIAKTILNKWISKLG